MTGILYNLSIFFGSPVPGRVTVTMRGATTRPLTVPPPMKDRPPHWGLCPLGKGDHTNCVMVVMFEFRGNIRE